MKFLCDAMLGGVGKWLRAAGYDTLIIEDDLDDRQILQLALAEERKIITRDRHFLEMEEAKGHVFFLEENQLDDCIAELSEKCPINWLHRPFSRCLNCNALFESPDESQLNLLPSDIRQQGEPFSWCPQCQKIFWLGSHTEHMQQQLRKWNAL